ncbi:MAG: TraR/DksA family transcriptional regulator [Massilia sp.]|jgi:DnaK suppressor protein|nr:TraR/DksA family transcriptional regulator [Massilia sp.]MDB5949101.1 TraR/DksA family transcriptional regulator [Massilia sp.]
MFIAARSRYTCLSPATALGVPSTVGKGFPMNGPINGLDQVQLALLKSMLEQRRDALVTQSDADHVGARERAVEEVETSPADKATVRLLNDMALEAAGHNAAQMLVLKHALAKFDDGSYGECEECGNPIGFSRLQARPEARLCITCQTRAEKHKG